LAGRAVQRACLLQPERRPTLLWAEEEADNCATILAEPRTRTLLLHGRTGCGKSSFIRAGLIPELENEGFGFVFLRRGAGDEPVIIRSTADPVMRIAEELFQFTQQLQNVSTAIGRTTIDLFKARRGFNTLAGFAKSCRDPYFLLTVLKTIADQLLYTLVIVIDQAEEVLTGDDYIDAAENDNQVPFFAFLKLFNASTLNVKLVVSLRTENFGEFFDHLHFDSSAVTDVKQVPLRRFARAEVRFAIELPTSKAPIGDHGSPHDVYRFEYERGLVDRIVNDLFMVDPSGGILPAMQIVCRDLFNEIRDLAAHRVITMSLYERGGGVAGRVDKHIRESLRTAITESRTSIAGPEQRQQTLADLIKTVITDLRFHPETRSALQPDLANADLERRVDQWRSALAKLARHQADGTVRTDVIAEAKLLTILSEMGVTGGVDAILTYLIRPDVLILRKFPIVDHTTGTEVEAYSLGHDAIGLVLQQWTLRREEEIKRLNSEQQANRLRKVAGVAVLAAVLVIALAAALIVGLLDRSMRQAINLLDAYAENAAVDRHLAATASIIAFKKADNMWYFSPESRTTADAAKMISLLPRTTIPIVDSDQSAKSSPMLYFVSGKIALWNGISKVQMIDLSTGQLSYVVDFSSNLSSWGGASLDRVVEVGIPDFYLFVFRDGRQEQSTSTVIAANKKGVILTKTESDFLEISKHLRHSSPKSPRLRASSETIFLVEFNQVNVNQAEPKDTIFAEAFNPIVSRDSTTVAFESAGWIDLPKPPGASRYINPIYSGISVREVNDRKRLNDFIFYDLATGGNDLLWSARRSQSGIRDCYDFCVFDRFNNARFISVYVPSFINQTYARRGLTVLDVQEGRTLDLGETGNGDLFVNENMLFDRERVIGGNSLAAMIMAMKTNSGNGTGTDFLIELYQISLGKASKIAELISPTISSIRADEDVPNQIAIAPDGSAVAYIGSKELYLWNTSKLTIDDRKNKWMDASPSELVQELCRPGAIIGVG
jgi:hypothetical protein